jgi:hypothetical protein
MKNNIYKKLLEIQKEIKGLSKDKKSHNYDYVTGNKLLSFIKPLMDEKGLILKQEILSIENTRQDYKTKYGEKSEILSKVMMKFTWIDCETGETDENLFGANGQNDWEKGLGSALTYAERYFLLKYFHIPTDKDDIDNPERRKEEKQKIIIPSEKLNKCKTLAELQAVYTSLTRTEQSAMLKLKDELKLKLK